MTSRRSLQHQAGQQRIGHIGARMRTVDHPMAGLQLCALQARKPRRVHERGAAAVWLLSLSLGTHRLRQHQRANRLKRLVLRRARLAGRRCTQRCQHGGPPVCQCGTWQCRGRQCRACQSDRGAIGSATRHVHLHWRTRQLNAALQPVRFAWQAGTQAKRLQ